MKRIAVFLRFRAEISVLFRRNPQVIRKHFVRLFHRLAGHSAIGYCPKCRRAIYETFSEHWKRGH